MKVRKMKMSPRDKCFLSKIHKRKGAESSLQMREGRFSIRSQEYFSDYFLSQPISQPPFKLSFKNKEIVIKTGAL